MGKQKMAENLRKSMIEAVEAHSNGNKTSDASPTNAQAAPGRKSLASPTKIG